MKIFVFVNLVVAMFIAPAMAGEGLINVASSYTVSETADRLQDILTQKGMKVFGRIKHSEAAQNAGVELNPTELIIFGNPKVGSPLMKCQQTIAIDLPQKALVWRDGEERVWITYNDPAYLRDRHGVSGCDQVFAKVQKALAGMTGAAASSN